MNDKKKEEYQALLSEIIIKQGVILGREVAVLKARNVQGITVNDDGRVTEVNGDMDSLVQKLIDEYVALSGQIVKTALSSVFTKYPSIKTV